MGRETLTQLRAGTPVRVGSLTLVPIERVHVTVDCDERRVYVDAGKRAAGVVILESSGARALDESGRALDLEDLANRVEGLRGMM